MTHFRFDAASHLPRQETAEIDTELTIPLGCTAVIGGLVRHEHDQQSSESPSSRWFQRWRDPSATNLSDEESIEVVILLTPRRVETGDQFPVVHDPLEPRSPSGGDHPGDVDPPRPLAPQRVAPDFPPQPQDRLPAPTADLLPPVNVSVVIPPEQLHFRSLAATLTPQQAFATESTGDSPPRAVTPPPAPFKDPQAVAAVAHSDPRPLVEPVEFIRPAEADEPAQEESTQDPLTARLRRDAELASVPPPPVAAPQVTAVWHDTVAPLGFLPPEPIPAPRRIQAWIPPAPAR